MKDKNTIIGIVLLAVLFFVFFWYTNKEQQAIMAYQNTKDSTYRDSVRRDSLAKITPQQRAAAFQDSIRNDSIAKHNKAGNFGNTVTNAPEQLSVVENNLMKVVFTNKGGRIKYVELKKYNSQTGGKVRLGATDKDELSYTINTGTNHSATTAEINFTASQPVKNADHI